MFWCKNFHSALKFEMGYHKKVRFLFQFTFFLSWVNFFKENLQFLSRKICLLLMFNHDLPEVGVLLRARLRVRHLFFFKTFAVLPIFRRFLRITLKELTRHSACQEWTRSQHLLTEMKRHQCFHSSFGKTNDKARNYRPSLFQRFIIRNKRLYYRAKY